jgi:hypothetical protein
LAGFLTRAEWFFTIVFTIEYFFAYHQLPQTKKLYFQLSWHRRLFIDRPHLYCHQLSGSTALDRFPCHQAAKDLSHPEAIPLRSCRQPAASGNQEQPPENHDLYDVYSGAGDHAWKHYPPMNSESNILLYQTEDGRTKLEVRLENETVWLTQARSGGPVSIIVPT